MADIQKDLYDLNFSENFNITGINEPTIDLELSETSIGSCTVSGTVTDEESLPVGGATIKLFDEKGVPYMHTLTNEDGNYTFSGLKSGNYQISCFKEDIVLTVAESFSYRITK